jgi:hypothetical protein
MLVVYKGEIEQILDREITLLIFGAKFNDGRRN